MSRNAVFIVGHSFIKAQRVEDGHPTARGSGPFLLARSGHKEALNYLKNEFASEEFGISVLLAPSYLSYFRPVLDKVAFLGDMEQFERPLFCGSSQPLVQSHLTFAVPANEDAEALKAKLDLNQIEHVAVSWRLRDADCVQKLKTLGVHVEVATSDDVLAERAALLSCFIRQEWDALVKDEPLAKIISADFNSFKNYFEIFPQKDGVLFEAEDILVFNKEKSLPTLNTPWGKVSWQSTWFYRLQTQFTSIIDRDLSDSGISVQDKEIGYWPGPMYFGRSVNLTVWDLLSTQKDSGLENVGIAPEAATAQTKIAQVLETLKRGVATEKTIASIRAQFASELEFACVMGSMNGNNKIGPLQGVGL